MFRTSGSARSLLAAAALFLSACAPSVTTPGRMDARDYRIYDVASARFVDFDALAERAAAAEVVFFGEQHGHQPGHRLQLALLHALAARGGATLSLEMFERDVAPVVNAYAAREIASEQLLASARPWPNYATDYRPQVDLARDRGWWVIAANVPRSLASTVAREGVAVLDTLDRTARAHAATEIICPADDYRARFVEEMRRHPMGQTEAEQAAIEQRYYESQCLKDETMAESIVHVLGAGARTPVVHLTGAFHSDRGDGIPARVLRRRPGTRMISLTVIPVDDLRRADPQPHLPRADYLLFTRRAATTPADR